MHSSDEGTSPRALARLAGIFYLLTIVMGVFAEMFVRGRLVVRDDAAATAANILGHEPLYRLGLAADLVMLGAYVAVTALLYALFRPVSRVVSIHAVFFSLVGIAVLAANALTHILPLLLLEPAATAQAQELALTALRLHSRGYSVSGAFFGVYMILIGWLVYRSRFMPRVFGVLMALGGLGYLINTFVGSIAPAVSAALPDFTILGGLAELAFTLWLLIRGVRQ